VYFPVGTTDDKPEDRPPATEGEPTGAPTDPDSRSLCARGHGIRSWSDFIRTQAITALSAENAKTPGGQRYSLSPETIQIKSILDMKAVASNVTPFCKHHPDSTDGPRMTRQTGPSIARTGLVMNVMIKANQEKADAPDGVLRVDYSWQFLLSFPPC
jgi:hypothetical protein